MRTILLALVFAILATPALASDGVLEINQTCAVQTGCFAGDTAGYPVTIEGQAGGSYRLTSNLIVPDENTDGIEVKSNDIGIDLNNFSIIRSGCEGVTTNCAPPSGTGSGIVASPPFVGVSVKNGGVTGMGLSGVLIWGGQNEARGLRVRWNRRNGISVGTASIVTGNTSFQNGDAGIFAQAGCTISGNTVWGNGLDGIFANDGSTIVRNSAWLNSDDGIETREGSTVSENTVHENQDDGIVTLEGSAVQRNTVRSNIGVGLNLGATSAYRENVISGNVGGTVTGGVNMFSNSCNGTTSCP